jgi:outer membrane immunogenic protein
MTCPSRIDLRKRSAWRRIGVLAALLAAAVVCDHARAADMSDEAILRGAYIEESGPGYVRWDGLVAGAQIGYSNLSVDFSSATTSNNFPHSTTTNSVQFGGFLGYNVQWDELVIGVEGAYNRPSSLSTSAISTSGTGATSSLKLVDYATFRARAGYAFGQFLPYAFVGAAVGRMDYATIAAAGTLSGTASRDNAYAIGVTAGLGVDVAVLPNIFVRAEYEYVAFSPVGNIRSSTNSARAGVGVKF